MKKFVSILLVILPCLAVQADVVFFKNSNVIYGKLLKENNKQIIFLRENGSKSEMILKENILRVLFKEKKFEKKYIYKNNDTIVRGYIVDENESYILFRKHLNQLPEIKILRSSIAAISSKKIDKKKLRYTFILHSNASQVFIEGDFNGWNPVAMKKVASKSVGSTPQWKKEVLIDILKKDEYQYRFISDKKNGKRKFIKFKVENEKLVKVVDLYKPMIAFSLGPAFYLGKFAENLKVNQPLLSINTRINLPFIWKYLILYNMFGFMQDSPQENANPKLKGLSAATQNYIFAGYLGYEFLSFNDWAFSGKLGGGYVLQRTNVVGYRPGKLNNGIGFQSVGLDVLYHLNRYLILWGSLASIFEVEKQGITVLNSVTLGIGVKL